MIQTDQQYQAALHQLSAIQRTFELLRGYYATNNKDLFSSISHGYIAKINELHSDIFEYLKFNRAMAPLKIRLVGPEVHSGIAKATLVGRVLSTFQNAIYGIGKQLSESFSRNSLSLDIKATTIGSYVLLMDFSQKSQIDIHGNTLSDTIMKTMSNYINQIQTTPEVFTDNINILPLIDKMARLIGGGLEEIDIVYQSNDSLMIESVINPLTKDRINYFLQKRYEDFRILRGRIIEIDVKDNTCELKPEDDDKPIKLYFDEEIEDDLLSSVKHAVIECVIDSRIFRLNSRRDSLIHFRVVSESQTINE